MVCSKNRFLSLLLVMLLLAPIAGAASSTGAIKGAELFTTPINSSTENDLFSELSAQMGLYNDNFGNVPLLVKRLAASEEVAGRIELKEGEMLYVTALMRGGNVGEFSGITLPMIPIHSSAPP